MLLRNIQSCVPTFIMYLKTCIYPIDIIYWFSCHKFEHFLCKVRRCRNIQCCVPAFIMYLKTYLKLFIDFPATNVGISCTMSEDERLCYVPFISGIASSSMYSSAIGSHCVVAMVIVVMLFSREGAQRMAKHVSCMCSLWRKMDAPPIVSLSESTSTCRSE